MNNKCKNCGGDEALHHYETNQCPVGGREAPVGRKQEWKSTTFESPKNDEIGDEIKKHLRISVDTGTHVYTDKQQIIVNLLWDGVIIDSDHITLS